MGTMLLAFIQTLVSRALHGPLRPTWSFTFQVVHRFMRLDWDETADWELPRVREAVMRRPYPRKYVKRVARRDETLGGVPVCIYTPPEKRSDGAVLFFHGGSFIYGSSTTSHAELLARLALEVGALVIGVEYRLAPEHPFPAQLEDALASWDALIAKIPADRVVMGGDSAGGNLAVETAIALRDRGGALPKALLLLSPWADLEMPGASFRENERYDFGTREVLVRHAAAYVGSAVRLDDPRVSPIHARLEGLPPSFVARGECEIPRDDIAAFTNALRAAGDRVTEHVAPDMPHNAPFFADYHPSALAAFEATARFVREQLVG